MQWSRKPRLESAKCCHSRCMCAKYLHPAVCLTALLSRMPKEVWPPNLGLHCPQGILLLQNMRAPSCFPVISLLWFGLSLFSFVQWRHQAKQNCFRQICRIVQDVVRRLQNAVGREREPVGRPRPSSLWCGLLWFAFTGKPVGNRKQMCHKLNFYPCKGSKNGIVFSWRFVARHLGFPLVFVIWLN